MLVCPKIEHGLQRLTWYAKLPLYCRELFDATPSEVALLFIPLTLPCLAAPVAGKLLDRVGSKWPAGAAYTLGSISFIGMAFVVHRAQKDVILLLLVLLCLGVVNILAYPAMYKEVVMTIEDYETRHPGVFGARGVYSLVYGTATGAHNILCVHEHY